LSEATDEVGSEGERLVLEKAERTPEDLIDEAEPAVKSEESVAVCASMSVSREGSVIGSDGTNRPLLLALLTEREMTADSMSDEAVEVDRMGISVSNALREGLFRAVIADIRI